MPEKTTLHPSAAPFSDIEDIIADIAAGKMVVMVDDENRENEGDLIMAAEKVRPEDINYMATHGRGLICLTMSRERCAQLRLPLVRDGKLELVPHANVTFATGLKEYAYGAELVLVPAGRRGGLYGGGGIAYRNTIFGTGVSDERQTFTGFSGVIGLKSGTGGAVGSQIELRWVFLDDAPVDPRVITFGVNIALSGRNRTGGLGR